MYKTGRLNQISQVRGSSWHSVLISLHGDGFTVPAQPRKWWLTLFRAIGTAYLTC
jgi:hypothetical protein